MARHAAFLTIVALVLIVIAADPARADNPGSNPAMNAPDQFAWQVFVAINRSAGDGTRNAVWETWAEQTYVYADPNKAPTWPGSPQPLSLSRSVQQDVRRNLLQTRQLDELRLLGREPEAAGGPHLEFLPAKPLAEEVRLNKATFDFIVTQGLWSKDGQVAAFKAGQRIDFPPDAKEIKAQWKPISEGDKSRYHWQTGQDGKTYGLIALHIMTKDVPNWFWTTFEHVDNPDRCKILPCRDTFGLDPQTGKASAALSQLFADAGMGSEWTYYRLDGTQTDFTDSTGRPDRLGNSIIEAGFVDSSSCITCHARATVDAAALRLSIFTPDEASYNGTPDPTWYWDMGTNPIRMKYLQLDFVWSFLLAKPKK